MKHPLLRTAARGRVAMLLTLLLLVVASPTAASAATGSVSGVAFDDLDRDGVQDPGEPGFAGHDIYLLTTGGQTVAAATTGSDGRYSLPSVAAGTYRVQLAPWSWYELRMTKVPTTTGSVYPWRDVQVSGAVTFDLGWRPITVSTDPARPISTATGPSGVRVESFTDALPASQVAAALAQGTLVGAEASSVLVRFGLGSGNVTGWSASGSPGAYTGFSATVNVDWASWLDGGDQTLFHEYGHAWSGYHSHLSNGDPSLARYLELRGIAGDSRLDNGHAWSRYELIAEDYRQLFGSDNARRRAQENRDLPVAADVAGLRDYLATTFVTPSSGGGTGTTPPPDTTAPAVAISSPSEGQAIAGTVTVAIAASDETTPVGELVVRLTAGGVTRTAAYDAASSTYRVALDTTTLADGSARLTAEARDAAGNSASTSVTVTVANATSSGGKGGGGKGGSKGGSGSDGGSTCHPRKGC